MTGPHDDDASGVTLLYEVLALTVAALTAATATAAPMSARNKNLLLTLPPPYPS